MRTGTLWDHGTYSSMRGIFMFSIWTTKNNHKKKKRILHVHHFPKNGWCSLLLSLYGHTQCVHSERRHLLDISGVLFIIFKI